MLLADSVIMTAESRYMRTGRTPKTCVWTIIAGATLSETSPGWSNDTRTSWLVGVPFTSWGNDEKQVQFVLADAHNFGVLHSSFDREACLHARQKGPTYHVQLQHTNRQHIGKT